MNFLLTVVSFCGRNSAPRPSSGILFGQNYSFKPPRPSETYPHPQFTGKTIVFTDANFQNNSDMLTTMHISASGCYLEINEDRHQNVHQVSRKNVGHSGLVSNCPCFQLSPFASLFSLEMTRRLCRPVILISDDTPAT